jgi:hypothetical protein
LAVLGALAGTSPAAAGDTVWFTVDESAGVTDFSEFEEQFVVSSVAPLRQAGAEVGLAESRCTSDPGGDDITGCEITLRLPDGTIALRVDMRRTGGVYPAQYPGDVVGGTGCHDSATGDAVLIEEDQGTSAIAVRLD